MDTPASEERKMSEIEVSLHGHSFKACGPAEELTKQFHAFVQSVEKELGAPGDGQGKAESHATAEAGVSPSATIPSGLFMKHENVLILTQIPRTKQSNADALLLLLYGFRTLLGQERAMGTRLMKAATATGLKIDRLARVIAPNAEYVHMEGTGKSRAYALNGKGVGRAEQLARTLA